MNDKAFTFRPGTCDENVYRAVVELNEYRLPSVLPPDGLVLDVGAHIGSFSQACYNRGARRIRAHEADWANFICARANLHPIVSHYPTPIALCPTAVWRSDRHDFHVRFSGYSQESETEVNTGGGNVMGDVGRMVMAQRLDDIIGDRTVRLLKLDCEYSEFPILLTSRKLEQVSAICGEYHELPGDKIQQPARIDGVPDFTINVLAEYLIEAGFTFASKRHGATSGAGMGLFWAWRKEFDFET